MFVIRIVVAVLAIVLGLPGRRLLQRVPSRNFESRLHAIVFFLSAPDLLDDECVQHDILRRSGRATLLAFRREAAWHPDAGFKVAFGPGYRKLAASAAVA